MKSANKIYVNAGVLMMALPEAEVTTQQLEDVVDTLLLAQLSAGAKYPQAQQHTQREQAAQRMLDHVCWVRLNDSSISVDGSQILNIADVVVAQCKSLFTLRVMSGFVELIEGLKSLPSHDALEVWHQQTVFALHTEHLTHTECTVPEEFMVCVKFVVVDAGAVMHSLTMSFATRTALELNYLHQAILVAGKPGLRVQACQYELNEKGYANLRTSVVKKLADKRKHFVMPWVSAASNTHSTSLVTSL